MWAWLKKLTGAEEALNIDPNEPVTWIDVRSAQEFSGGHVAGALNIPHSDIGARIGKVQPNKQALIYVYCHSGMRSAAAKKTLNQMGYTRVVNKGAYARLR